MYFNEINILDYYSVEWKSACVGVYQLLHLLRVSVQSPSSGSVLFELAKVIASFSKFK